MSSSATVVMAEPIRARKISRGGTQSIGLFCVLALVFLRFSALPEIIASLTGVDTFLLYVFAPGAILAVMSAGGMGRLFRARSTRLWLWFMFWMIVAVPFSSWQGGSFVFVLGYLKQNGLLLLATAGVAQTWADCKKIMYAVALAGIFNLATAYFFQSNDGRLGLSVIGTIGNANDFAAHLLSVLPFLLFIALRPNTTLALRLLSAAAAAYGTLDILRTASRGAMIALVITGAIFLVRGSARQRLGVGVAAMVALIGFLVFLPASARQRLFSFSKGADADAGALESSEIREYLLKQSIVYTFEHPLFGIGPAQFAQYIGKESTIHNLASDAGGLPGSGSIQLWRQAHNSYTQISSECGIPGLLFYLSALLSTFGLLAKIRKKATGANRKEIATATDCLTMSLIAYSVAVFFVNFGYYYEVPAISGLVVAMWFVVSKNAKVRPRDHISPDHPAQDDIPIGFLETTGSDFPQMETV
jgi:O-antigen ligase